jgi:exosome complex component CSL4
MPHEQKFAIPGQYIIPTHKVAAEKVVEKYVPGKGTTISSIDVEADQVKSIPVIVATIIGKIVIREIVVSDKEDEKDEADSKDSHIKIKNFVVNVIPKSNTYMQYQEEVGEEAIPEVGNISINLPQEGDVVLARITRLNPRQAFCEILTVEGHGNVLNDSGLGANGENAHRSIPAGGGSQSLSSHTTIASQASLINAVASDLGETFKGIIRTQDVRLTDRDRVKIIECFKPGDIVRAVIISLGDGSNYYLSTAKNDLGVVFARSEGGAGGLMYAVDWQTMICPETGVIEKRKCAKPFTS